MKGPTDGGRGLNITKDIHDLVKDIPAEFGPNLRLSPDGKYWVGGACDLPIPDLIVEAAFCGYYWKYLTEHSWCLGTERVWSSHGPDDTKKGGYRITSGPVSHEAPSLLETLCMAMKACIAKQPTAIERAVGPHPTSDQIDGILEAIREQHAEFLRQYHPFYLSPEGKIVDRYEEREISVSEAVSILNEHDDHLKWLWNEKDKLERRT